jgi:ankyrin repeat protein
VKEGDRSRWKAACGRLIQVVGLGFLLFVAYVGLRNRNSMEPLHQAIVFGDVKAVERLLKKDPTLARNPLAFGQEMPLSLALNCQGTKEKIELLLAYGADLNARSGAFKLTPLQYAAWSANMVAVKTLLAHNPEVNAVDGESPGRTALNYAVTAGNRAIIEMLLAHGADIAHGYSVLYDAESHPELFDYLLAKGADPNAQNSSQDTPLLRAIDLGDTNRIATILRYHPDLAVKNSGDRTALAIAVDGGQSNVTDRNVTN